MIKNLKINILVIVIFFLFIITGIHPAMADENIHFDQNKDFECNCNCENNNINYLKLQNEYIKLDIYLKILNIISKQKVEINKPLELKNIDNPPLICTSLFLFALTVVSWIIDFEHSANHYPDDTLLHYIYIACMNICIKIAESIGEIARALSCAWIESSESNNILINNFNNKIWEV